MNWYLVKLIYQVVSGEGNHTPQFDEQWRLIWADEKQWAYEKACTLGRMKCFEFLNAKQEKVSWKFLHVTEVFEISVEDGAQIYSATNEPSDVSSYLQAINGLSAYTKEVIEKSELVRL